MTPTSSDPVLNVLILEDHPPTRVVLQQYFERRGHHVQLASTCREAKALLREVAFHLFFSDLGLPDGFGWEVLEGSEPRGSPYSVAASGYGSKQDRARSQACGFKRHLVKPFSIAQLHQVVQEALTWRDSHQESP